MCSHYLTHTRFARDHIKDIPRGTISRQPGEDTLAVPKNLLPEPGNGGSIAEASINLVHCVHILYTCACAHVFTRVSVLQWLVFSLILLCALVSGYDTNKHTVVRNNCPWYPFNGIYFIFYGLLLL
jgi:hypothetical protein